MAHHFDGKHYYGDTQFIQQSGRVYPGGSLEHMGFGEFTLKTPDGDVEFDRMRGRDFPGQSGRSHRLYDNKGGKVVERLVKLMEQKGKSQRMAYTKLARLTDELRATGRVSSTGWRDLSRMIDSQLLNDTTFLKNVAAWLKSHLKREGIEFPERRLLDEARDLVYHATSDSKQVRRTYESMMKFMQQQYAGSAGRSAREASLKLVHLELSPMKRQAASGAADLYRMVSSQLLNDRQFLKSVEQWLKSHLKREGVDLPEGRLPDQARDLIYSIEFANQAKRSYESMMKFLRGEYSKKKAGNLATVEGFLQVLTSKITQWDKRYNKSNPHALPNYLKAVDRVRKSMSSDLKKDDESALSKLKKALDRAFDPQFPAVKATKKQIDQFIETGKKPSLVRNAHV